MTRFSETLENRARQLASDVKDGLWDMSIPGMIRREVALTVDQIRRQRQLHENQLRRLLYFECKVGTDLLQLQLRIPRYTVAHFPEEDKFKKRLFDIENQRQKLNHQFQERHQSLEDRLLTLINKHQQLDI